MNSPGSHQNSGLLRIRGCVAFRLGNHAHVGLRDENLGQTGHDETGDEAADMRPVGDTVTEAHHLVEVDELAQARTVDGTDRAEHARELHHEPTDQEPVGFGMHVGGSGEDIEARDGGVVPEQQVAAQNASDGTRGAEGRNRAHRIATPVGERGEDAAQEVERQIVPLADTVFHALAEDKEEDHIAEDVTETAMQEHGREDGSGGPEHQGRVAGRESLGELGGDHEVGAKELLGAPREKHGDFPDESDDVSQDEPLCDRCGARATQIVLERKHSLLLCPVVSNRLELVKEPLQAKGQSV
ncbi:MAG: hypothetical protein BWY75_01745 [bacterium ADurb.Bin425]|nr:MAG: hypothetical protein BWY75_01745 [bacterium ADurb.Bin425]